MAVLISVVLTLIFFTKKQYAYTPDSEVNLVKVQRTSLENSVYIIASVVSDEIEYVYSDVDAPVLDVKVRNGDMIKSGDVICSFDCTELKQEYESCMMILEQLRNIDGVMSDGFAEKKSREENILKSQVEQLKSVIDNYQKKFDESKNTEEKYLQMYEESVKEQEELKNRIEASENERDGTDSFEEVKPEDISCEISNGLDIVTDESLSGDIFSESTDNFTSAETESDSISVSSSDSYEYLRKLYQIVTEKTDSLYSEYCEMKNKTEETLAALETYRRELSYLTIAENADSENTEEYYTPENYEVMISSYLEKTEKLRKMIDSNVITASRDGIVTDVSVKPGEYAGENIICCIQNPEKLHFSGYITPEDLSRVSETSCISVYMTGSETTQSNGRVISINDCYDVNQRGYEIIFTVEDIDKYELYPGHEVAAEIILESQPETLAVPYDAVFQADGTSYVRRYSQTGDYEDIPVKKGLETSYYVAVESDELFENDLVATEMLS